MEFFDPSMVEKGGLVFLMALAVLAFMREWVVVGVAHRREVEKKEEQIAILTRYLDERDAQIKRLAEVGHTVDAVLRSIDELAGRKGH